MEQGNRSRTGVQSNLKPLLSPSRSIENLKSLRALLLVSLTNKSVHHDQEKRGQRQ